MAPLDNTAHVPVDAGAAVGLLGWRHGAILDATGVAINATPFAPERVWRALHAPVGAKA